jgi:hypothetical protein
MGDVKDLAAKGLEGLKLPEEVTSALKSIQADVAEAYRDAFFEMLETMKKQASALNRIQGTLNVLVEQIAPQIGTTKPLPVAFAVAGAEAADLATAVVMADPIAAGFTLSQADLARALGITDAEVSILARGFGLRDDPTCAVTVRSGKNQMVNFNAHAIGRFRELVAKPPRTLTQAERKSVERVRSKLVVLSRSPGKG